MNDAETIACQLDRMAGALARVAAMLRAGGPIADRIVDAHRRWSHLAPGMDLFERVLARAGGAGKG